MSSAVAVGPVLFGRRVIVEVGVPGQSGRAWEGLRTTFSVKRTVGGAKPGEARVELYNLTRDSSAFCQTEGAALRLLAGYGTPESIFLGDLRRATRNDSSVDSVTSLEASDGGQQYATARIAKSFSGEVTARRVFEELASAAGLPLGALGAIPDVRLTQGVVLVGQVRDQLDRLAATLGMEWSIQDGELQLLARDQHTGEDVPLISADSGLVGSPKAIEEKDFKGLEVVSLLQPKLRPGRRFQLQSLQFQGTYRVEQLEHTGDTFGQEFYTKVRARVV